MHRRRFTTLALALLATAPLAMTTAHARGDADFPNIGYATWNDDEPAYRLYPGDELDIAFPTAPELNKTQQIQPDGRITLPLIGPVMAADRTLDELQSQLGAAYASQLVRPEVTVSIKTAQALKVFVGGEVDKPGVYDMPGDIDALRAIIQAGGFKNTGKPSQVVIIRRGADGRALMRVANFDRALRDPAHSDLVPLRRFDIVFVPKTGLAEVGRFVSQLRDALPIQFSYVINGSSVVQ